MNWAVLAAVTTIAWGAVGLLQKLSASLLHPSALLVWVVLGLIIGCIPLIVFVPFASINIDRSVILLGVTCGLLNAIGSWCLFRALGRGAPAAVAVPFTALYPLITVLLAVCLLGESLSPRQYLGALLAVGGGALLSREDA